VRLAWQGPSDCASHQRAAPPSGRPFGGHNCGAHFVEHIKTDHRRAAIRGGMQSGMIGKAEIAAKPNDTGRRVAGHQTVNSEVAVAPKIIKNNLWKEDCEQVQV